MHPRALTWLDTRGLPRMRPGTRRATLAVHVMVAVGWLGLDLGLLALGITGLVTGDPDTQHAAYRVMDLFADVLVVPISLATLLTGLLLGLFTPWGLFRHYWVVVKLALTLVAATASIFALRARTAEALETVAGTAPGQRADLVDVAPTLVVAPSVALAIYVTATFLAIVKPWGRTPRGDRSGATGALSPPANGPVAGSSGTAGRTGTRRHERR